MAGFYSILSKGINALDRNTPEARRRLNELFALKPTRYLKGHIVKRRAAQIDYTRQFWFDITDVFTRG